MMTDTANLENSHPYLSHRHDFDQTPQLTQAQQDKLAANQTQYEGNDLAAMDLFADDACSNPPNNILQKEA